MAAKAIHKVYANLCEKNGKNFYSIPKKDQPYVREVIEADGYIILEDGSVIKAPAVVSE